METVTRRLGAATNGKAGRLGEEPAKPRGGAVSAAAEAVARLGRNTLPGGVMMLTGLSGAMCFSEAVEPPSGRGADSAEFQLVLPLGLGDVPSTLPRKAPPREPASCPPPLPPMPSRSCCTPDPKDEFLTHLLDLRTVSSLLSVEQFSSIDLK